MVVEVVFLTVFVAISLYLKTFITVPKYPYRFTVVADMEGGSGNTMARSTRSNARAVSALCLLTGTCASSNSKYGDKRTVGTEFLGKRSEVIEYVKVLLNFVFQY